MLKVMAAAVVLLAATAVVASSVGSAAPAACPAAAVHYTRPPTAGFQQMPWVRASPLAQGLIALLAYWPDEWRSGNVLSAQIYPGGRFPTGEKTMKILWVFSAPKAKSATDAQTLIVKGRRLDGAGKTWQRFYPISYTGQNRAPSFASVIDVSSPGCWRLDLTAGSLHGTTTFRVLSG